MSTQHEYIKVPVPDEFRQAIAAATSVTVTAIDGTDSDEWAIFDERTGQTRYWLVDAYAGTFIYMARSSIEG